MGSSKNPVGEGPTDPYEKYRVEPVSERRTKGDEFKPFPDEEKSSKEKKQGLAAYLLGLFQKALALFLETHRSSHIAQADAAGNLKNLKKAFDILKREDRSQDVAFLGELSQVWTQALEDSLHFRHEEAELIFKMLVKKISHYPENLPHTLGYYLTEYAGQKWVPFPYMELIQKLHREHELNPNSSILTEWVLILEDLIASLQKE